MPIRFEAIPDTVAAAYRAGAPDANGQPPEHRLSGGPGTPCRHCLKTIPEGEGVLVLAYRPFDRLHPYAELGPIFLCSRECASGAGSALPDILLESQDYLMKAYGPDEWIIYGTGAITPQAEVISRAEALLARDAVAFVDIRSAQNNCFLTRVRRA